MAKKLLILINILLLSLGIWQIYRGIEKQNLIKLQSTHQTTNIKTALSETNQKYLYKNININGKFSKPTFFLYRNQQGKNGYWVVNPLTDGNKTILVAHDFIQSKKFFLSAKELNFYKQDFDTIQNISGYIVPYIPRVFNLVDDNYIKEDILLVQNITPKDYQKFYGDNVNFMVIKDNLPSLKQVSITPDKHFGYAITWLGLFVVSLYFTYAMGRKQLL